MQRFTAVVVLSLAVLFSASVWAEDYEREIDKFFSLYDQGEIVQAVDSIYATNRWINTTSDQVLNLKGQLNSIQQMLGEYLGQERVGLHSYGDRLIHVTYLALYERQPLRMEFTFYKPGEDWIVYSFSFDDGADEDLQRSARMSIAAGD